MGYKTEFFVCIGFLVFCPIFGLFIPVFSFFCGIGFAWNLAVLWMIYLARHDVALSNKNKNKNKNKDVDMAYIITGGKVCSPPTNNTTP